MQENIMIKYWYTIDKYNSIFIDDDDEIISQTNPIKFLNTIGLNIYYNTKKHKIAKRELSRIFHDRNFYKWYRMKEERGLI